MIFIRSAIHYEQRPHLKHSKAGAVSIFIAAVLPCIIALRALPWQIPWISGANPHVAKILGVGWVTAFALGFLGTMTRGRSPLLGRIGLLLCIVYFVAFILLVLLAAWFHIGG